MGRNLLSLSLALGLAGLLLTGLAVSVQSSPPAVPVARPLNVAPQVWEATANDAEADFLLILEDQADLSAEATFPTREARLSYVYDALRQVALRSQAGVRARLDAAGVDYRPFYIVNMLAVRGDRSLATRMAAFPGVAAVVANPRIRQALPEPSPGDVLPLSPQGIEWNVARINADQVWALGYTGQGVVVAGQDTGYDWDHPALIRQYRGYSGITVTHDYNWHDAIHTDDPNTPAGNSCGFDSPIPCDDHGHGTHTMGTVVGDDGGGNQIGVAPGARWIGCRNMEQGWGTPATYAECFEFFLAPYPVGGDPLTDGVPSLAPHVINNSWTCPPAEGCDPYTLQSIVENVRAAGIVVVASAGNSGSGCGTVQDPPAIYDAAFSVGATNSGDNIASFSSRGPVTVDGSGRLKPDVSAPGVSVRSCIPGGSYSWRSGTSMAGPHVAGVVALLCSADPGLVGDVDAIEQTIAQTARPRADTSCGGEPGGRPNNVYGWGIVDALAAVRARQPGLEIAKQSAFLTSSQARVLVYTLSVTNTSYLTLTQVAITDTVPASTTFAWAGGDYVRVGDGITWTAASLASQETLTATLAVTVEHLAPGTRVVNAAYGTQASEVPVPVIGTPLEATIPWRTFILPILRTWSPGGGGSAIGESRLWVWPGGGESD
jgi:serine protease AprX